MNTRNSEQNIPLYANSTAPFNSTACGDIEALLKHHMDSARQMRSEAFAELFRIACAGVSARIRGLKQRLVAALDYRHTGPWYSGHGPFASR